MGFPSAGPLRWAAFDGQGWMQLLTWGAVYFSGFELSFSPQTSKGLI